MARLLEVLLQYDSKFGHEQWSELADFDDVVPMVSKKFKREMVFLPILFPTVLHR